jgi:hypothetical protein
MVRGPGGDRFRPEWLAVALPALAGSRVAADRLRTVGVEVGEQLFQVCATGSDLEVSPHDGRDLDALLRADAAIVLGLAAGMLALDDVRSEADIEGDEAALRAIFGS